MKHILKRVLLLPVITAFGINCFANTVDSLANSSEKIDVAYRKVDKSDLLGAVAHIDFKELQKINYNVSVKENFQSLLAGSNMWNYGDALVLIDGVPRDVWDISTSEVESVTILKSAAAAVLYGTRADNGVILITTKRGSNKGISVKATINSGVHIAKRVPQYVSSAEYMTLYNSARVNDNLSSLYSNEEIYNHSTGDNPYQFPNINFYSPEYISRCYNASNANVQIDGGSDKSRYFTNIEYSRSGDYLNFGEAKNNNNQYLRARGNVDFVISPIITSYANANVVLGGVRKARGDYWAAARSMRPNRYSPIVPISALNKFATDAQTVVGTSSNLIDNKYFLSGTQLEQTNIFADYYAAGYDVENSRKFQFDVGLNLNLSGITEGLSLDANIGIDYIAHYKTSYTNKYAIYEPVWSNVNGDTTIIGVSKWADDVKSGSQNVSESTINRITASRISLNYDRSFSKKHNVSAMVLASGIQQVISEEYHKPSSANLSVLASYNFAQKYYAEFAGAYVHSAKLAEGHRGSFSPAVTLGWNMAREKFLEDSFVNDLMLSASYGVINSDRNLEYYQYESSYGSNSVYSYDDGLGTATFVPSIGNNPYLDYIKRKDFTVSIRSVMFDRRLSLDFNFFNSILDGGIIVPTTLYPQYFVSYWPASSYIPNVNYNQDQRRGFDIALTWNQRFDEVSLQVGVVGSYVKNKALRRDEIYDYDYQAHVGKDFNSVWGLESDGLFNTEEEIAESVTTLGGVKPGDIKYIDQNDDNVIDSKDRVVLGSYTSPINAGLNLAVSYKGFTLAAYATMQFGGTAVKNTNYDWVFGDRKYSDVVRGCWTAASPDDATYPRLTTLNSENNFQVSDYWTYSANRVDLSKVQLTYDFNKKLFKDNSVFKAASIYVGGYNLLTFGPEAERFETNLWGAPFSRLVNLGVSATF